VRRFRATGSTLQLVCLLATVAFLTGCGKHAAAPAAPPVTISHPRSEPVTAYLDLSGTVAASQSVDLVARVPGYLQSVNFADGTDVEAGQLLFVIEPAPYEEQVKLSEAALLQAQSEYDRQLELVKQSATAVANVEKWQSQRDQAAAQVALLVKVEKGFIGIEIKSRSKAEAKDFTGLTTLADRLGKRWLGGVCLYRGGAIEERDPKRNLWAVPINRWLS